MNNIIIIILVEGMDLVNMVGGYVKYEQLTSMLAYYSIK